MLVFLYSFSYQKSLADYNEHFVNVIFLLFTDFILSYIDTNQQSKGIDKLFNIWQQLWKTTISTKIVLVDHNS